MILGQEHIDCMTGKRKPVRVSHGPKRLQLVQVSPGKGWGVDGIKGNSASIFQFRHEIFRLETFLALNHSKACFTAGTPHWGRF